MSDSKQGETQAQDEAPVSRRALLTGIGGVAAGAGLAVLATATPAEAVVGDMFFGQSNDATNSNTELKSVATSYTLTVRNTGTGSTNGGMLVDADHGPAITAVATEGIGVSGTSTDGLGVRAQGAQAALYLVPKAGTGPPAAGLTHFRGEVVIDSLGRMFINSLQGNPGVWVRPGFNSLTPIRVADTRAGTGTPYSSGTKLGAGQTLVISFTGVGGLAIPAGATAVALNITATGPTAAGYLTLYPDGVGNPGTSNVNFNPNQTVANFAIVPLSSGGKLRVYNNTGAVHVVLDASGFYF